MNSYGNSKGSPNLSTPPMKGTPIDKRPSSGMALNTDGPKIGQGYTQYPSKGSGINQG